MRKWILYLLPVLLAVVVGCGWYAASREETPADGYSLYFLEADLQSASGAGALREVKVSPPEDMDTEDTFKVARWLLKTWLAGPLDETLKPLVPAGTSLFSLKLDGTRAIVDMSFAYGSLSGINLTMADQAVALILTQLPDILSVKITVQGRELAYRDRQIFTARDVLLAPEGDVVGTVDVLLYFVNEKGFLASVEQTLELYEGDTQVSAVVRAMENGPEDKDYTTPLPAGFRTKSAWQEEDVCYVNLSSGTLGDIEEPARLGLALQAMARALCSLDGVQEVRYLVDGEAVSYYGRVNISRAYTA